MSFVVCYILSRDKIYACLKSIEKYIFYIYINFLLIILSLNIFFNNKLIQTHTLKKTEYCLIIENLPHLYKNDSFFFSINLFKIKPKITVNNIYICFGIICSLKIFNQ